MPHPKYMVIREVLKRAWDIPRGAGRVVELVLRRFARQLVHVLTKEEFARASLAGEAPVWLTTERIRHWCELGRVEPPPRAEAVALPPLPAVVAEVVAEFVALPLLRSLCCVTDQSANLQPYL